MNPFIYLSHCMLYFSPSWIFLAVSYSLHVCKHFMLTVHFLSMVPCVYSLNSAYSIRFFFSCSVHLHADFINDQSKCCKSMTEHTRTQSVFWIFYIILNSNGWFDGISLLQRTHIYMYTNVHISVWNFKRIHCSPHEMNIYIQKATKKNKKLCIVASDGSALFFLPSNIILIVVFISLISPFWMFFLLLCLLFFLYSHFIWFRAWE